MARLWIGIWPPDDVVAVLEELHRKDQVGTRFVRPENWHVTLRFLGDADPDDVDERLRATSLPAAVATLGPAVDVLGEQMLVAPVRGVEDLATAVRTATADLGTDPVPRRFDGHLTLARMKRRANVPRVLGHPVYAEWDVTTIALVQSHLRHDGVRYDTLAEYPVGIAGG